MGKLQEKEQSSTRFLSAASHDLRQPIAAAMMFVETLKLTEPTPAQNELIVRLDHTFKQQALDHQLRFRLFLPKHKAHAVQADMILLQSVLMNLVTNNPLFADKQVVLVEDDAFVATGETSAQFIDTAASSPWPVLQKPVSLAKLMAGLQQSGAS